MKKMVALLIAIIICSSVFVPFVSVSADRTVGVKEQLVNDDKWLTLSTNTSGPRYFVDTKGNPVNLFGTARCQYHKYDEEYAVYGEPGIDHLIEHYAGFGMNAIRLAISCFEICGGEKKTPEEIDQYILESIDPDVQGIIRNGMYVMIDIHMYPQHDKNVKLDTFEKFIQYPYDYYIPLLQGLARMYKDEPMVAVYEIWNEPVAADRETVPYDHTQWNNGLREYFIDAVDAIREIDTRHVIMVSDYNAGWGLCTGGTWGGHYDRLDPVYRNTCFSTHIARDHVTLQWNTYRNWYRNYTRDNNICVIFGEIETENELMNTEGMKNLLNFFEETKNEYHFSGFLWRPHGWEYEYHELWAQNGWADSYCNVGPYPTSRYTIEAEDVKGGSSNLVETVSNSYFFGGKGISLKAGLAKDKYFEANDSASQKLVYKAGEYTLMVRARGDAGYEGDFVVGYKDVEGNVHQIARFHGKNTYKQEYYQTVKFKSTKAIASFVFFGCEAKEKSVKIDRLYLIGKAAKDEVSARDKYTIPATKKINYLSGKTEKVDDTNINNNPSNQGGSNNNNNSTTQNGSDKNNQNSSNQNQNNTDKNQNNNNENDKTENSNGTTTIVKPGEKTTTTTTTTTTTEGSGSMTYVWIGIILGAVAALFVIIYVIVVIIKKKKQKVQ